MIRRGFRLLTVAGTIGSRTIINTIAQMCRVHHTDGPPGPEEGLARLQAEAFDCLAVDVWAPIASVLAFLRSARMMAQDGKPLFNILLSIAIAQRADIPAAVPGYATGWIPKPMSETARLGQSTRIGATRRQSPASTEDWN
jgi:CheY-like chemotaxis protein